MYEFVWNDFCDWYVELLKPRFFNKEGQSKKNAEVILIEILNCIFIMMNPFMPHITEELWHKLNDKSEDELLSNQLWPSIQTKYIDNELENSFDQLFEIIRLVRNLRAELGLKPSQLIEVFLVTNNKKLLNFINQMCNDIKALTKSSTVHILTEDQINKKDFAKSFSGIISDLEVYLPFQDIVNLDSLQERLSKDLKKVNIEIDSLQKRINNKKFIEKAPIDVVEECRSKLNEANLQHEAIKRKLAMLD